VGGGVLARLVAWHAPESEHVAVEIDEAVVGALREACGGLRLGAYTGRAGSSTGEGGANTGGERDDTGAGVVHTGLGGGSLHGARTSGERATGEMGRARVGEAAGKTAASVAAEARPEIAPVIMSTPSLPGTVSTPVVSILAVSFQKCLICKQYCY